MREPRFCPIRGTWCYCDKRCDDYDSKEAIRKLLEEEMLWEWYEYKKANERRAAKSE